MMVIDRCNISYNNKDGVFGERIDGQLFLTDSSFNGNGDFGIKTSNTYGQVDVNGCSFQDNSMDGFNAELYGRYHVTNLIHGVSATNTSFSNNENKGMDLRSTGSCNIMYNLTLSDCYVNGNIDGGLEVYDPCYYDRDHFTVSISDSVFNGNKHKAFNLRSCLLNKLTGNIFENNIRGTEICNWLLPYYLDKEVTTIRNNYFLKNSADMIFKVNGHEHRRTYDSYILSIDENMFKNNTCRNVFNIQWEPQYIDSIGITIKNNTFKDNIPTSLQRYIWTLPVVVVSYDKPSITFATNFMDNPLFPFQLNVQGDNFGTTTNAVMNWWGTVCEVEIEESIIDQRDRYNYPLVQYFPYLNSANISDSVVTTNRSVTPFVRGRVIGGHIDFNISLEKESSPYLVDRDIFIKKYATLYIQPGTSLHFTPYSRIYVQGKLVARGTITDKIILEPQRYPLSFYKNSSALVRLAYDDSNSGLLEILEDQDWQRVCYQGWNQANTDVICRQLGFHGSLSYTSVISDGNVSIWSMTLSCTGHETDFRSCEQTELKADCSANSNVYIECEQTQWAGLLFPADAHKSTLEYLMIRKAGSEISRYYDWYIGNNEALMFHIPYHTVENIEVEESYRGLAVYPDPINQSPPFKFLSFRDCTRAVELYQSGLSLQSLNVSNCQYSVYFDEYAYQSYTQTQQEQQILKFLNGWPSANQCTNHVNLTATDVFIVTPNPSDPGTSCSVSITSNVANSRIGLSVLYSTYYNPVSVVEMGDTILTFKRTSAFIWDKVVHKLVSNTSSIRIEYQREHSSSTFYVHVRVFQPG